jgi:hypothetical protein
MAPARIFPKVARHRNIPYFASQRKCRDRESRRKIIPISLTIRLSPFLSRTSDDYEGRRKLRQFIQSSQLYGLPPSRRPGKPYDNDLVGMELLSSAQMPITIIGLKLHRYHALPCRGDGTAMLRNLVLVLVMYPLLTPPGVCQCGAVHREGGESWFCNGQCGDTGVASRFEQAKTNCLSCNGRHDVPTGHQCPPGCPGNQKVDHSKLVEQSSTVLVGATAIYVLSCDVDTSSGQRIHTAAFLLQPSAQPIYITLCTLVI